MSFTKRLKPAVVSLVACAFCFVLVGCGPSTTGGNRIDGGSVEDAMPPDAWTSDPFVDDDGDRYTEIQGDCNDADPDIHPFAVEICDDGKDNDCNGYTDGSEQDGDGDGWSPCRGDCNDSDINVNPSMPEIPDNGKDDNCDGITDGDFDGDGWTEADGDCNDSDPNIHPLAKESCYDGIDNNCNGYTDGDEPDWDGDGYGPCQGDCDDTNQLIHPGRPEIPGDGIDNNCDFLIDEDIDGDGWTEANGDCDDEDPEINPSVFEICNDGIDNDCDNITDTDCLTPCDLAAITSSSIGCEYYAVDMDQYPAAAERGSCFAVIISNTDLVTPANVTIYRWVSGAAQPLNFPGFGTSRAVDPGTLQVFRISGSCTAPGAAITGNAGLENTNLGSRNAFKIVSDLPVVAYQINPYEAATIHTTDASLLIPMSALGNHYYVIAWEQYVHRSMLNVIGTTENTTVTVISSTSTLAGGSVPALLPGGTFTTTLNEFDNLQIASSADGNDLTGTWIEASAPVAVFGGQQCSLIPVGYGYCDHLEEQMMPLATWGTEYVAARHPPRGSGAGEGVIWRFVAAENGTTINFDPPSVHTDLSLNAGQMAQFETTADFVARSSDPTKPFFVVQYMLGSQMTESETGQSLGNRRGDPAMTISIPTAQYLDSYIFLSDPTYAYNWLVVVRSDPNDVIHLDCFDPIPNERFTTIGAGPYQVARITLSSESGGADGTCSSGAHRVWGDGPFGIWVFGVYSDTSYGYPGGMNLEHIYQVN